jgi:hypothetical protein
MESRTLSLDRAEDVAGFPLLGLPPIDRLRCRMADGCYHDLDSGGRGAYWTYRLPFSGSPISRADLVERGLRGQRGRIEALPVPGH